MNESNPNPGRILPDTAICGVKPIGNITGFAHYLVDRPVECRFVLYFGEGNIWRHPRWKEFTIPPLEPEPGEKESE